MPTYEFTGDMPVVFIGIQKADGSTWEPSKGDIISIDQIVEHPLLSVVVEQEPAPKKKPVETEKVVTGEIEEN